VISNSGPSLYVAPLDLAFSIPGMTSVQDNETLTKYDKLCLSYLKHGTKQSNVNQHHIRCSILNLQKSNKTFLINYLLTA